MLRERHRFGFFENYPLASSHCSSSSSVFCAWSSELLLPLTSPLKTMGAMDTMILDLRKQKQAVGRLLVKILANWSPIAMYLTCKSLRKTLSNKIVVHLHMLRASMKDRVRRNSQGTDIITPQFQRMGEKNTKDPLELGEAKITQLQWRLKPCTQTPLRTWRQCPVS